MIELGVNIDHVATLRQARGTRYPSPLQAALMAETAGADAITLHLREDRRHIQDADVLQIREAIATRMNLESAVTDEMVAFALRVRPHDVCLVPERREERTTEGGLDVVRGGNELRHCVEALKGAGIRVSLFIEPALEVVEASARLGAHVVELHTGAYCERALADDAAGTARELARLERAARAAAVHGLEVHAGHGLTFSTVAGVARIAEIVELNIGHFLVGEAIFTGLGPAIRHMRALMDEARATLWAGS
jgi:pyridoxine 5-phosphate synthase